MSIVYIGMDVHKDSYTLSGLYRNGEMKKELNTKTTQASPEAVIRYIRDVRKKIGSDVPVLCGYEAGCLGYYLQRELKKKQIPCVIMAPTSMPSMQNGKKNDRRDACSLAKNLDKSDYKEVYVPSIQDKAVKDYIRMRDNTMHALTQVKNQILAFCLRHGFKYTGKTNWTQSHIAWLKKLDWPHPLMQETMAEYLARFDWLKMQLKNMDAKIESIGQEESYREKVGKMGCFMGVKTLTALAALVEVGDFNRFANAFVFGVYLGLTPRENSSASRKRFGSITKMGNSHLRSLLIEAAQCYGRCRKGYKSDSLKQRQKGQPLEVIRYADRSNERMKAKFIRLRLQHEKAWNVAVTAIARELACFMWGMMTGKIA